MVVSSLLEIVQILDYSSSFFDFTIALRLGRAYVSMFNVAGMLASFCPLDNF